jgi:myosin-1
MLVAKIQAAYRGLLARRFVKKLRAYTKICRWYRKIKSTSYFSKLESAFKGVADRPDFGKGVVWPKPIPGAGPFDELAHRIHTRWWVSSVLKKYEPLRAEIELKLPAYNIMKGRRSEWGVGVPWLGNYCAKSDDRDKFGPGITSLFEKFGDNKVEFSSRVSLLNKKGKQEERALVVSNKHLYVLDVKKWKSVDKKPTPIDDVEGITVSTGEDQLVVIAVPGGTDLVVKLQGQALSAELVCAILRGCAENIAVAVTDEIKVTLKGKESTLSFEVADANKSEFKASKAGVRLVTRKQSVMLMRERLSSNASP